MGDLLRDIRFSGIAVGNALVMTVFSLWTNWTTIYFVDSSEKSVGEFGLGKFAK